MSKKSRRSRASREASTLLHHKLKGKTLIPPAADLETTPVSWRDQRLPEILWGVLLLSQLDREVALSIFRKAADFVFNNRDEITFTSLSHSAISQLDKEVAAQIIEIITASDEAKLALQPLLCFPTLPASELWRDALSPSSVSTDEMWAELGRAVAKSLYHQSEAATDCRWLNLLVAVLNKKMHLLPHMMEGIFGYPNKGDLRYVAASIRASEVALAFLQPDSQEWSEIFWKECLEQTSCVVLHSEFPPQIVAGTTRDRINKTFQELVVHWSKTIETTAVDPKHDAVFGIALYSIAILEELIQYSVSQMIIARAGLRTIVECLITLGYLLQKDDPSLWIKFRRYGTGQAKLQYLKLNQRDDDSNYVEIEFLQQLANEDMWEEFVKIELGNWANSDLRKISDDAGLKDIYDRFYAWTSSFGHGQWGAMRDSMFDTCANPLHRLHRIPRSRSRTLPDVIPDACELVDKILELLSAAYPTFDYRVTLKAT